MVADAVDGEPRVLIDPNDWSGDGKAALAGLEVSHDGRLAAYARSEGGTDWRDWRVKEVDTGRDLPDLITFTKFTPVSWTPDASGFYYSRHPVGPDGKGDGIKAVAVWFHRLGTSTGRRPRGVRGPRSTAAQSLRASHRRRPLAGDLDRRGHARERGVVARPDQAGRPRAPACSTPGTRATTSSTTVAISSTSAPP